MKETFRERELSEIAMGLLESSNNLSDLALILEKLEFALFKLEWVIDEYCKYASGNQQFQAKTNKMLLENKTRGEIAIRPSKQSGF